MRKLQTLPGDYVAGFVDGEGCFALKFVRQVKYNRKNTPEYFFWDIEFAIVLHGNDLSILEKIRERLNCGKITTNKLGHVRYSVNDMMDLTSKIVPFFEKYTLRARKKGDFLLWKEALEILIRNQQKRLPGHIGFSKIQWLEDDLKRLAAIRERMKEYKGSIRGSKWLKE